jgi:hypothetical protein
MSGSMKDILLFIVIAAGLAYTAFYQSMQGRTVVAIVATVTFVVTVLWIILEIKTRLRPKRHYKSIGAAHTLRELQDLLEIGIAEAGGDATWSSDKRAMYILGVDGHRLSIQNEAKIR